MRGRQIVWVSAVALAFLVLVPAMTFAQSGTSGIAGVVRDMSGAVLPGVTVEAASPALIEKVRSVVTDSEGNYKIVDVRPGVYTVTFSLTGFKTVKREGIELLASFTATVSVDLEVGAVEETVTAKISDGMCGASHQIKGAAAGLSDRECTIECIKARGKYVLVDESKKVIPIANQDFAGLPTHADHVVKLTGELKGDAILVSKIEMAAASK